MEGWLVGQVRCCRVWTGCWSEGDFLALEPDAAQSAIACLTQPLHGCEVLSFESTAACPSAASVGDMNWSFSQSGKANGNAKKLTSSFQRCAIEVDGRWWCRFWSHDQDIMCVAKLVH
jgi:hypothetical protein